MATESWQSLNISFDVLKPLEGPLKSALQVLETVEAVLEAILDIVKAFLIDFGNPLQAIFALLLAAIRAIINQIKSTGFSILLVHPDFSRQDFTAVLQSVSGSYPGFENKVISKFYDSSDIFRPQYPPGSSVGMLIFYIGTDSPGDLLLQLFALLQLINVPNILTGLPAPVGLKVNPIRKSGDPIASFKDLFSTDIKKSLSVEWQMPMTANGTKIPGFLNSLVSFYNSFRFPNFIVERSESPQGEDCQVQVNSLTMGNLVGNVVNKYNFPPPVSMVSIREEHGDVYRNFAKKINITGTDLLQGEFTSTYRYVDSDPALEAGKAYFYRVRAYFGSPDDYLATSSDNAVEAAAALPNNAHLIRYKGNQPFIRYGTNNVVMGPVSPTVRGFVPRITSGAFAFNPYDYIYQAVQAAILLNFDLPTISNQLPQTQGPTAPNPSIRGQAIQQTKATPLELAQRTGWGTLAAAAGQMAPLKAAFKTSDKLIGTLSFNTTCRRIANQSLTNLYSQPRILNLIQGQWNDGVRDVVNQVLNTQFTWSFPEVTSGFTQQSNVIIEAYLANESTYVNGTNHLSGPYPVNPFYYQNEPVNISADGRSKLAAFLQSCLVSLSGNTSYLSWYSVGIGDLFPQFVSFIFDIEQFLLALLHALQSVLQFIEDIILTLITKIQQLEQILQSILALINLLNVNVRVAMLGASSSNGSVDDLVTALRTSTNKPTTSPYGLHSGIVMTCGGPGEGFLAALKAVAFVLSLGAL